MKAAGLAWMSLCLHVYYRRMGNPIVYPYIAKGSALQYNYNIPKKAKISISHYYNDWRNEYMNFRFFKFSISIKKEQATQPINNNDTLYEDLTPKSNADEDSKYSDAINWALNNAEIKNIALTGPYGSGKSSIIKTHIHRFGNIHNYLNISLATFKYENGQSENLLEKSILQQMFYKENSNSLPYSRFKKIANVKPSSVTLTFLRFILFVILMLFIFNPELILKWIDETMIMKSLETKNIAVISATLLTVGFIILGTSYFLSRIYLFIGKNINLTKVSFSNMEIELANNPDSSIFHKYLDEIIYFFEATKYDVIIFEDLDRFDNIDIFENLRELNTLINQSEQINRRIVFIYAVKDDMFGINDQNTSTRDNMFNSRNRTKFFDFMIPVIPIINSSNSGEILLQKIKRSPHGTEVSEDFINDITTYIDDMRILINICNEYITYKIKLSNIDLISDHLLAMIVYKNIYPADFADLQLNNGMVYEIFHRKNEIIRLSIEDIDNQITNIESFLDQVALETIDTINELQIIYYSGLGFGLGSSHHNNYYINLDGTTFYLTNQMPSDFFEKLRRATNINYNLPQGSNNSSNPGQSRRNIETIFGTKKSYFEREKLIQPKEQQQIESSKQELEILYRKKEEISSWTLQELIIESATDIFTGSIRNEKLLIYLIRNGYIDDMYQQYITYFYPGSLTSNDMKFIMSVKDQEPLPASFRLTRIEGIYKRLYGNEYKRPEVLNYDLVEYVLSKDLRNNLNSILIQLINESESSFQFINNFKNITNNKAHFIKELCNKWSNFWNFIESSPSLTEKSKNQYLIDIITFGTEEDILFLNQQDILTQSISKRSDFLSLFHSVDCHPKVKSVLLALDVKFKSLDSSARDNILLDFVYSNHLYEINSDIISFIMEDQLSPLNVWSYSTIINSTHQHLINYIDSNINEYVENVFLYHRIADEDEQTLQILLNRDGLKIELKEIIIDLQNVLIKDITDIIEPLWKILSKKGKIVASWHNLMSYYKKYRTIDESMIQFLNVESNCFILSEQNLSSFIDFDNSIREELSIGLIECDEISNNSFEILTSSLFTFEDYPIEELTNDRVRIMVENDILLLSTSNFSALKQKNYNNLHIRLLEKYIHTFIQNLTDYMLDNNDAELLLNSTYIGLDEKDVIYHNLDLSSAVNNLNLINAALRHILNHNLRVDMDHLIIYFDAEIRTSNKIELFNSQMVNLNADSVTVLLNKLGPPYSNLTIPGKRPSLENNQFNKSLVILLKESNYLSSWREEENLLRIYTKYSMLTN